MGELHNEPTGHLNEPRSASTGGENVYKDPNVSGFPATPDSENRSKVRGYPCSGCGNILANPTETCFNCNVRGIDPGIAMAAVAAVFCVALACVFLFPKSSQKPEAPPTEAVVSAKNEAKPTEEKSVETPTSATSSPKTAVEQRAASQDSPAEEPQAAEPRAEEQEKENIADDQSESRETAPQIEDSEEASSHEEERGGESPSPREVEEESSQSDISEDIARTIRLADSYYAGSSVPRDRKKALELYLSAGQLGNIGALMQAGKMYETGDGIPRNDRAASQLYFTAAELGDAVAQNRVGLRLLEGKGMGRSVPEAIKWLSKASELGLREAQYNLGLVYFRGEGIRKDMAEAHRLMRKAADAGYPHAAYWLGEMYSAGNGVAQDADEAIRWLQVAVDGGLDKAKKPLMALKAFKSQMDDGGPQFEMLRRAALAGDRGSMFNLAVSYDEGKGVRQDKKEARYWYSKAAMANLPQAQHNLGIMLLRGEGGVANRALAYAWLRVAKENGATRAADPLKHAESSLTFQERQQARASYESIKRSVRTGRFDD